MIRDLRGDGDDFGFTQALFGSGGKLCFGAEPVRMGIAGSAIALEIDLVSAQRDFFVSGFCFSRARLFWLGRCRFGSWHQILLSVAYFYFTVNPPEHRTM